MNSNIRLYVSIIWICIMILSIVMVCYKHNLRQYILPGLGGLLINTLLIYHIDLYTKTLEKDQKYNISKLIICIITMVLLSYYLTRWKLINGPFNYSDYLSKPVQNFESIFKIPI